MHFDWWTFSLQTVNFAVLVWLLHRFLYQPVLRVIAVRRSEIEKQFGQATAAKSEASSQMAAIAAERARIAAERDALLKTASIQAAEASAARLARAEREAATLVADARKTIAAERAAAFTQARGIAVDVGCDIARRLLDEIPIQLRAEAWLERFEQHLAALPIAERNELVREVSNGVPLHVVTAAALPADSAEAWRTRLRRALGNGITVDFAADPSLIAGVELHFTNAILRFSWQSTLSALRSGIDAHAVDTANAVVATGKPAHADTR